MMNKLKYEATTIIVNEYASTCMYANMNYYDDWLVAESFAKYFIDTTKGKEINDLSQEEILDLKQAAEHLRSVALDHVHPAEPYIGEWFSIREFSDNVLNEL